MGARLHIVGGGYHLRDNKQKIKIAVLFLVSEWLTLNLQFVYVEEINAYTHIFWYYVTGLADLIFDEYCALPSLSYIQWKCQVVPHIYPAAHIIPKHKHIFKQFGGVRKQEKKMLF